MLFYLLEICKQQAIADLLSIFIGPLTAGLYFCVRSQAKVS